MQIDPSSKVKDMTAEELFEIIREALESNTLLGKPEKPYVYGLAGIAELFGCSKTQAGRIKSSGKIDAAITQIGNIIITDAKLAVELAGKDYREGHNHIK